jgi:hypothetical protein
VALHVNKSSGGGSRDMSKVISGQWIILPYDKNEVDVP